MCLIVDTNCLSKVFKQSNKDHSSFAPVLAWILNGNGKLIIGGNTFKREILGEISWFRGLLIQLTKAQKVVTIEDSKVDLLEEKIRNQIKDADFDDPHIVALAVSSKTKIVCTQDKRSLPHLCNKDVFPKRQSPPAIYSSPKNQNLLCDSNICACCQPKVRLNKRTARALGESLR